MIAFAVTALFAVTTFVALAVIASSLHRACSVYRALQHALAHCEVPQAVMVRMKGQEQYAVPAPRMVRLRLADPARRAVSRPVPQPGWRAAA